MNVFDLRDRLVADYAGYTRSFIKIADPRIVLNGDGSLEPAGLRRRGIQAARDGSSRS